MRKFLATGAALMLVFALSSVAAARGPANEFAAGSAKSEAALFFGDEHASFSAHNVPGPPGTCDATGQIVYKSDLAEFTAKIDELTIVGSGAFFGGDITKVVSGAVAVGDTVWFDATDSGMPGGTGDTFLWEFLQPGGFPGDLCFTPIAGHPITQGNIVIKTTGPLP